MSLRSLVVQFKISCMFFAFESKCLKKIFKILRLSYFYIKWLESFCRYSCHEVLCGGRIYKLHVDAVIVLVWCVPSLSMHRAV